MITKKNTFNIFILFLILHLIFWTLVPAISNQNLPLDTIEALAWGSNLDWGFNKHPPLSAFVVKIFYEIFGNQDWAYYLLSQIFVISTFYVVWILSKEFFLNESNRLVSILLLEGIFFYNYTTPEFNVYICELPFWALTVLFCWRGIKNNKILDWLLFGVFAALGTLSHYLFLYLLAAIDIFIIYLLIKKKLNLKCLIFLSTYILVLLPHLIWLKDNNYITLNYAFTRTGFEEIIFLNHIIHPLTFLGKQFGILIPFLIMFLFLFLEFSSKSNLKDKKLLFLVSITILPIILIFLTSSILGVKIRTMWMTPFYLFFGVLAVFFLKRKVDLKKINKFITVFLFLFVLSPVTYLYVSISEKEKRTDYEGKEIARLVQVRWDKNFTNEIEVIVGDEWYGGNLSYHLRTNPIWFYFLDNRFKSVKTDGGFIFTQKKKLLTKEMCPGLYGSINNQAICMIGTK